MSDSWIFRLLFAEPPHLERRHRRSYLVAVCGSYIAWLVHVGWMLGFFALDIRPLFYFNTGSVLFFILCIWLLRAKGAILSVMCMASIEVLAHMLLAVYVLGWSLGFQHFAFIVVGYMCLGHFRSLWVPLAMALLSTLAFFLAFALSEYYAPAPAPLPEWVRWSFYLTNVLSVFGMISIFAFIFSTTARNAEAKLEDEYDKSEGLLLNILPRSVADRLKEEEELFADDFPVATVLFTDMVGVTKLSSTLAPAEVIRLLNTYFEVFDELVDRHGVEKIKTIGDSYMLVAGVPDRRADHAEAAARMALDMLATSKAITKELGIESGIRIGLCSGPVTAGIIGFKKFAYDVWGDTVNTASRMESTAPTDQIQIAESTHLRIKDSFETERRGHMQIKGKGTLPLY
mgnify:CR=1 FL=1